MPEIERSALVAYSPARMFALVNDIESYPAFLPWCRRASVDQREPGALTATMEIAKGRLHKSFTTRNHLAPPHSIEMRLVRGPFERLAGEWRFTPVGDGCRVELHLRFEYSSRLVALTLGPVFGHIADSLVSAFCRRPDQLYGAP